uniref:Uncharacterized protein n=1 Tax=Ditylenchus dipsaci TaxID=166011 RepID=A0A915CU45_9BILA
MVFDNELDKDTPLGLLRGIKYGTESYHVLFKRLCSYAGLHCMVIKGYSKSAGYQPGFVWRTIDSGTRGMPCFWMDRGGLCSIEYDDHYFMTDPESLFMSSFLKTQNGSCFQGQSRSGSSKMLPLLGLCFQICLRFSDQKLPSVILTDSTGAATIPYL